MSTLKPTREQLLAGDYLIDPYAVVHFTDDEGRYCMEGRVCVRDADGIHVALRTAWACLPGDGHWLPPAEGIVAGVASALNYVLTGKVTG